MRNSFLLLFLLSLTLPLVVYTKIHSTIERGGPDGWRAVDRFEGFRYEWKLFSPLIIEKHQFLQQAQKKAKELKCFGWIQEIPKDRIVGEARCPKGQAQEWIQSVKILGIANTEANTELHHAFSRVFYANTKIRYHFSHFRILSDPKYLYKTCFERGPHACSASTLEKTSNTIEIGTTNTVQTAGASTSEPDPSHSPFGHSRDAKDEL